MSNRSAEFVREAPLETESSFVDPGDSTDASGPWNPVASDEIPNCLPAGSTCQPAAVRGPPLPAACAVAGVAVRIASARIRAGIERLRVIERGKPREVRSTRCVHGIEPVPGTAPQS